MTGPGIDPTMADGYDGSQELAGGGIEGGGGIHPAWNEALDGIPEQFHDKLTGVYRKWTDNVNNRFERVHQKYDKWDPIIEKVGDPETVSWAVNMLQALEQNPREVYDRIGEYYRFNQLQQQENQPLSTGQGRGEQQNQQDDPYADRFAQLERQNQLMTDYLSMQREAQQRVEADQWLDSQLESARKKFGDFDTDYVLAQMQKGFSADEAAQAFTQMREKWGAPAPKPLIMGAGGGIAGSGTDFRKMKDSEVSSTVAEMLNQAFRQAQ